MNDWTKTLLLIGVAGLAFGLVQLTKPTGAKVALLSDQGAPLVTELGNPLDVAALEVVSFDEQAVRTRAFKVESDGKSWRIPSAFNYPADAQDGVAKAASAFAGLIKERVVSDQKTDHAKYGLIDPTDDAAISSQNRGTRVTFKNASGRALVDVIIGRPIDPADDADGRVGPKRRYIREAGKPRVYVTTIDGSFSTKFVDWVETDLLKVKSESVQLLEVDRYNINDQTGRLENPKTLTMSRSRIGPSNPGDPVQSIPGSWGPWTVAADPPPSGPGAGEKVADGRILQALNALASLKIVGVQPKPANLMRALASAEKSVALDAADQVSLRRHGFYIAQGLGLVANEGTLTVKSDDGVLYQIMLGELATEADAAASGGRVGGESKEDAKDGAKPDAKADAKADAKSDAKSEAKTDARFVMVLTDFDPKVFPEIPKPAELTALEAKEQGEAPAVSEATKKELEAARKAYQAKLDERQAKVDAGKKRAAELSTRFAQWYYLVDLKSLDLIRPARQEVVVADAPPPGGAGAAPAGAPANMPSFPPTPMQ